MTHMRPSSTTPAISFKLLYSRACTPQITNVKYNLPRIRENTYHFNSLNVVYKHNTLRNVKRDSQMKPEKLKTWLLMSLFHLFVNL